MGKNGLCKNVDGGRDSGPGVGAVPRSAAASLAATATDMTKGTYMSAADAAAAVAATAAKQGTSPNGITRILQLTPYTVSIEHRIPVAQSAAIHDKDAELFIVIDGSATLVTGGTLVNPTRNGDNVSGTAITGGTSQKMSKGDFTLIPQAFRARTGSRTSRDRSRR